MRKIIKIEPTVPALPKRKRVAAYARVSRDTERLMHSASAQISYYSELIQRNPEWEYAGVYADCGVTGTLTDKREEFQRMLTDCESGRIDIILTKSISRFARNTVDLLNTVRRLKELGIEVRFEKEQINSLTSDGELMLTLLASFAEEESRSISENCKWGIRKRFQSGEIGTANKHLLGYQYDEQQKKYVIIPEEAESVRWMFQMYIDGLSFQQIADRLNAAGIHTILGNNFQEASVRMHIFNEVYVGDIRRQKTHTPDPIKKHKVPNRGELPQYLMTDCHEAIIDRETYAKVQAEMERRAEMVNPTYCFTGKIHCAICGGYFTRKKGMPRGKTCWICRSKKEVGRTCNSVNFSEEELKKISASVLGLPAFDETEFESRVRDITILKNGDAEFHLTGGETLLWKNLHLNPARHPHSVTDAFKGMLRCAKCGNTYHRVNAGGKWVYWYCMGKRKKLCDSINYTDYQLRQISAHILGMANFDEQLFSDRVQSITVFVDGSLEYHLKEGRTETWQKL